MKKFVSCLLVVSVLVSSICNFSFAVERDLEFVSQLSDEELEPLVVLMKDRISNQLPEAAINNPGLYRWTIIEEFKKYGGNTLVNIFRKEGPKYREILEDVCKKEKIATNKEIETISTEELGTMLVKQTFAKTFDKMTVEQKEEFINNLEGMMSKEEFTNLLKEAGGKGGLLALSGNAMAMILVKSAGFGLYKISAIIVFGIFHALGLSVPHWLAWGGLATIIKTGTGLLFGPIVWAIFAVWGTINIASPATRVTVPGVVYLESMRILKNSEDYTEYDYQEESSVKIYCQNCNTKNNINSSNCKNCGTTIHQSNGDIN